MAGDWDTGKQSVLFLPGFQGSRLYRQGIAGEDKLWVPSRNQDAEQLFLDKAGVSIDPGIYTRDIIDSAKNVIPIYDGFINFMDGLAMSDVINGWSAFAYDWRRSVDDIASSADLVALVNDLADSSDSGKVTIIAHSNGGLIAKLLLNKPSVAQRVDTLILVATP